MPTTGDSIDVCTGGWGTGTGDRAKKQLREAEEQYKIFQQTRKSTTQDAMATDAGRCHLGIMSSMDSEAVCKQLLMLTPMHIYTCLHTHNK